MNDALQRSALALRFDVTGRIKKAIDVLHDCPPPNYTGRTDCLVTIFDMSYQTVRSWINDNQMPESSSLAYVADRLGVRLEWLMCGTGRMRK